MGTPGVDNSPKYHNFILLIAVSKAFLCMRCSIQITNIGSSEFCQGNTMRWGIAWTFDESIKFPVRIAGRVRFARCVRDFVIITADNVL